MYILQRLSCSPIWNEHRYVQHLQMWNGKEKCPCDEIGSPRIAGRMRVVGGGYWLANCSDAQLTLGQKWPTGVFHYTIGLAGSGLIPIMYYFSCGEMTPSASKDQGFVRWVWPVLAGVMAGRRLTGSSCRLRSPDHHTPLISSDHFRCSHLQSGTSKNPH